MTRPRKTRPVPPAEEGYMLVAVIFLLALFTIGLAVAVPNMAKAIQVDRERETVHRGKQYIRAIKLYYKKFSAYPPNVDALVKTNEIRFLRKKYIDPTTGKDEWKPIQFGQAKTQTLGFFGQPLAGTGSAGGSLLAGVGPQGGNANSTGINQSIIGQPDPTQTTTQPGAQTPGALGGDQSTTGSTGQTFGGAGIVGFSPQGQKKSILLWKKKEHYNEWEFVYDPLAEMQTIPGGGTQGNALDNGTNPTGGQTSPTTPTTPITPITPTIPTN